MNLHNNNTKNIGLVKSIKGDFAFIELKRSAACKTCIGKSLCWTGKDNQSIIYKVKNSLNARTGDNIQLSFEPKTRILSSFIVYIFPLLLMMSGYIISKFLLILSEDISILIGLGFLLTSFFIIRQINNCFEKKNPSYLIMIRKV